MSIENLVAEIHLGPLGRSYAGMSDKEVTGSLNAVDRTRCRATMSGDEIFQQAAGAEFEALTGSNKQLQLAFCGPETINLNAGANVAFVRPVLGVGSATVTALGAACSEDVGRETEHGIPEVKVVHVQEVRRLLAEKSNAK